jgi:ESS family glutamate:Na+ symporter
LGTFGQTLAQLLWGFHFIIGSLFAILLRMIFDLMKKKKIMIRNYPNNYLLQRISGGCFDFMIAASIAAISLGIVLEYIVPIGLITTAGGIVTIFFTIYICKRIYPKHQLENILALFGMLTGTISTGLALLREVDPNFRSEAAENLVLGSGVGLFLGFPLMILLNVPIFRYLSGQPIMYLYTLLGLITYFAILLVLLLRKGKQT